MLSRHAAAIRQRFPQLLAPPPVPPSPPAGHPPVVPPLASPLPIPILRPEVLEYMLGTVREGSGAGCYVGVYPSSVHHVPLTAHLRQLRTSCAASAGCSYDFDRREAMHLLVHLVLDADSDVDSGADSDGNTQPPPNATAAVSWRAPYLERCTRMLEQARGFRRSSGEDKGSLWARRTHIFASISDLAE